MFETKARHSDRTLQILNAFMPKRPYLATLKWKSQVKNVLGVSDFPKSKRFDIKNVGNVGKSDPNPIFAEPYSKRT